jgi:hypothetical protein
VRIVKNEARHLGHLGAVRAGAVDHAPQPARQRRVFAAIHHTVIQPAGMEAEAAIERLAEAQTRTEGQVSRLVANLEDLNRRAGRWIEADYRDKVGAYFGQILKRARAVSPVTIEDTLEAQLSQADFSDVLLIDVLVNGRLRQDPADREVWLAVEVSPVVDQEDVARAVRRAAHLRQAGLPAIPVVAGEDMTRGAERAVALDAVLVLQNGHRDHWEEALARYVSA